jgi:hypothetical protein
MFNVVIIRNNLNSCRFLFCVVENVKTQSVSTFASGEGQRVYDFLVALGCINDERCRLSDFTPAHDCDYRVNNMQCDAMGFLRMM